MNSQSSSQRITVIVLNTYIGLIDMEESSSNVKAFTGKGDAC
jgi:hypothetical protein